MKKTKITYQNHKYSLVSTTNRIKNLFTNPLFIISAISLLFLAYTILYPLWDIIFSTFTGGGESGFSLSYWKRIINSEISKAIYYKPLVHSLGVGFTASVLSLGLGGLLAWIVVKTDIKFKKTLGFLIILPYMLPSWFKAFAWLIVFKNDRVGGNPGLLQFILNISPPDWLSYGFLPIILTMSTHYYAFAYLLVGAALSSMSSSLEEQARILGANRFTITRRITFPLVLPALLSAFILTISRGIGTFGIPAFLGLPVKYYTLSTMLYSSMKGGSSTDGFILSLTLIVIASVIIYFNQRALGKRNYETIGGKDSRTNLIPLGKWKGLTNIFVWGFIAVVSIFPVVLLLYQTLMLQDGVYSINNFTSHFWLGKSTPDIGHGDPGVLKNSRVLLAARNSIIIAFVASISATLMGLIFGYVISRERDLLSSRLLDQVSFLPYLIPGIAFSAIYLTLFSKPTWFMPALYGTMALLILITAVKELPFATRAGVSTMFQISEELEEAAKVTGSSWFRRFRKILLPLSKNGLFSGFILVFISAMKELDLLVLLVTPRTNTLTTLTFEFAEKGYPQFANAIILIIIIIIIVTYFLATTIGKADISRGIGGR